MATVQHAPGAATRLIASYRDRLALIANEESSGTLDIAERCAEVDSLLSRLEDDDS